MSEASSSVNLTQYAFPMYASDIEKHWKNKEIQRKSFYFSSPQITLRYHLVVWLKNVADKLKVSFRTFHLAIHVLDTFMDKHSITKDRLGFVALVCLMLAVKFDELDSKIPKISELNKYDGFRYSNSDFVKVEVMVLNFIDFDLTQPTAAHFAEYYTMGALQPQDLKSANTCSHSRLNEITHNIVAEFLDVALKETAFLHFPPSQVAAACVLATRKRMNFSPPWTSLLVELTGYSEEILSGCTSLLLHKFNEEITKKTKLISPDRGYISESP